jgi:hypothetical protein
MSLAIWDKFTLRPTPEFREPLTKTLVLETTPPGNKSNNSVSEDRNDSLKDFPLSKEDLKLVFDPSLSPTSFSSWPTAPDALLTPHEEPEMMKDFPLSREDLKLVFDAAASPTSFSSRPTVSDALVRRYEEPEMMVVPKLVKRPTAVQKPLNVLSGDPDLEAEPGVRFDYDPTEEEVMLNWLVEF